MGVAVGFGVGVIVGTGVAEGMGIAVDGASGCCSDCSCDGDSDACEHAESKNSIANMSTYIFFIRLFLLVDLKIFGG